MPLKSFYETVCCWVISCCAEPFTVQEMCKRAEEAAFELDVSVGGDILRRPKTSDSVVEKSTNNCLRFGVRDGDGFGPADKAVDADKEESLAVVEREGTNQIKVDVAESGIG